VNENPTAAMVPSQMPNVTRLKFSTISIQLPSISSDGVSTNRNGSTFLLPFLFVLTPSLLMDGSWTEIALNFSRVTFGIWLGTMAAVGFSFTRLGPGGRALYALVALAVVLPPEAFAQAIWIDAAGIVAACALLAVDWLRHRALRQSKAAAV